MLLTCLRVSDLLVLCAKVLLLVQRVQRHQRVLSHHEIPAGITRLAMTTSLIPKHFRQKQFEAVTHSRSGQTLHATESSVSLVASLSSLTSLSSVSLSTSRALNGSSSSSKSVGTRSEQHLKVHSFKMCTKLNIQRDRELQQDRRDQQNQRDPKGT